MPHAEAIAMVAEPVGPGEAEHRQALQEQSDLFLARAAVDWSAEWTSAPTWNADGSLIRAGLRRPLYAFDVAVALQLAVWPLSFRVAVGTLGKVGALLQETTRSKLLFGIRLPGLAPEVTALVEQSARLHADILRDWKPSRAAAAKAMREVRTQAQAAERLGIRQQSVSEAMRAAHAKDLIAYEEAVRQCLGTCSG